MAMSFSRKQKPWHEGGWPASKYCITSKPWWRHQLETVSALLAICAGNSPVNSPQKGQSRGALMFSLICSWMNGWVNNREAGDLRRHRAHYDVIVMSWNRILLGMCMKYVSICLSKQYERHLVYNIEQPFSLISPPLPTTHTQLKWLSLLKCEIHYSNISLKLAMILCILTTNVIKIIISHSNDA